MLSTTLLFPVPLPLLSFCHSLFLSPPLVPSNGPTIANKFYIYMREMIMFVFVMYIYLLDLASTYEKNMQTLSF
jgi:hypothetical protein